METVNSSQRAPSPSFVAALDEIATFLSIMGVWVNHQLDAEDVDPDEIAAGFNLLLGLTERTLIQVRSRIQ